MVTLPSLLVLTAAPLLRPAGAFVPSPPSLPLPASAGRISRLAADLLGGTAEFEAWFRSDGVGGKSRDGLRHAPFRSGTLRGLEYSGDKMRGIVEVPEKVVLRTEYNRKEGDEAIWDARLAVDLVRECLKGEASDVYGYCSLLARGVPFGAEDVPPPTAPDAIRHWTASQKARLKSSSRGEKLLRKEKSQTKEWSQKYASLPPEDRAAISEGQFLWAMEAVNSRAFKGNYGGGLLNQLQRLTLPIVAAAFGAIVIVTMDDATADLIAQACGLLVLGPALLSVLEEGNGGKSNSKADAVMLPFIDSANHSDEAESNIEYDPVGGKFILDLGNNCLGEEDGDRQQLYINYGRRSDSELLLNYGFLPGVGASKGPPNADEDAVQDQQRARLAKEYVLRNP